jgi:hypothetical protein
MQITIRNAAILAVGISRIGQDVKPDVGLRLGLLHRELEEAVAAARLAAANHLKRQRELALQADASRAAGDFAGVKAAFAQLDTIEADLADLDAQTVELTRFATFNPADLVSQTSPLRPSDYSALAMIIADNQA